MRKFKRVTLIAVAGILLLVVCGSSWVLFYSRDLPDIRRLADYAPETERHLIDPCLTGPVTALPFNQISPYLRAAVADVGVDPEGDSVLSTLFKGRGSSLPRPIVSLQIARTLFCAPSKKLERHAKELRTAIQIDEHFSKQQRFTIYMNRREFGECGAGVENAAQCLFHKHAVQLNLAEAALLAGVIVSPSRYSPVRHPDRALERRNEVIDKMTAAGHISPDEAASAKLQPLLD